MNESMDVSSKMKVSEISYSLSGEGVHALLPAVIVRLQGCNLRCSYCDTKYALDPKGGEEMNTYDIYYRVRQLSSHSKSWVLITGGEPLMQGDLLEGLIWVLKSGGYLIEVETNGSFDPPTLPSQIVVDSWNVDVKCPSSGVYGTFRQKWPSRLRKRDQLKFVVGTVEDLNFVRGFLNGNKLRPTVLVSPVIHNLDESPDGNLHWSPLWSQEVAEFCKEQNVRMSLQQHKFIWGNQRAR